MHTADTDREFDTLARVIEHAPIGDRAALARLQPDALQAHQLAALGRAFVAAGFAPERWTPQAWSGWAAIARGMALTGHDPRHPLGRQLADAGVSSNRVNRLLTSRGDAFGQMLAPLLRLMASKAVAPNWRELGELILCEGSRDADRLARAEDLRLRIAGPYFAQEARKEAA